MQPREVRSNLLIIFELTDNNIWVTRRLGRIILWLKPTWVPSATSVTSRSPAGIPGGHKGHNLASGRNQTQKTRGFRVWHEVSVSDTSFQTQTRVFSVWHEVSVPDTKSQCLRQTRKTTPFSPHWWFQQRCPEDQTYYSAVHAGHSTPADPVAGSDQRSDKRLKLCLIYVRMSTLGPWVAATGIAQTSRIARIESTPRTDSEDEVCLANQHNQQAECE